jgi:hypothetical protein
VLRDQLQRMRDQLGYFWRALVPLPIATVALSLRAAHPGLAVYLQCAVVLAFTARFSIGNFNYAAAIFAESATWFRGRDVASEVRRRFAFDSICFALQLFTLDWMGYTVQDPLWFRRGMTVFLLVDLLFLGFDRSAWPLWILRLRAFRRARGDGGRPELPKRYAPRIWVINNFCTAMALIAFAKGFHVGAMDYHAQALVVFGFAVANSAIDIYLTHLHLDVEHDAES